MALSFPNVSLLGLTQDNRFFGAGFEYQSIKRLTVQGLVIDLTAEFGVTGIWNGPNGVLATIANNSRDYQDLVLNGVSFGSGKVESIDFDPGLDVRTKGYTANILVQDSGNMFNFTGVYYTGVDTSNFQYLNSFNEDYSFSRKLNGGYSYSHNASIQFSSGVGSLNAIGAAQSVARTLFTGSNLGLAFYPSGTNKQGKRYYTESYNIIDNACGFQETFDFDRDAGNYSAIYSTSIQLDEQGVITATENGVVRGIENPNYQKALTAVNIEMTGAYNRCVAVSNVYFTGLTALVSSPISQGRTIDIFNNNIGYTIVFNNSPVNKQTYFWDYTVQIEKQNGISTATENGTIQGRGPNISTSFSNAQAAWTTVKAGIVGRTSALFVSPYNPSTNYLENKNESYSPNQGRVGYNYRYSNDPTLISNNGVRRKVVTVEENAPVYSYNKINIVNLAEIIQNDYQSTVGTSTTNVSMEGDKTTTLSSFLAVANSEIASRIPAGSDIYALTYSYSYSPNEGTATAQKTWAFNRSASPTINP